MTALDELTKELCNWENACESERTNSLRGIIREFYERARLFDFCMEKLGEANEIPQAILLSEEFSKLQTWFRHMPNY